MKKRLEWIWITLVALTLFAFLLGYFHAVNSLFVVVLLFTTFLKGQLVIDYFMELHTVRLKYRLIPTFWLILVITLIGVAYFSPVA